MTRPIQELLPSFHIKWEKSRYTEKYGFLKTKKAIPGSIWPVHIVLLDKIHIDRVNVYCLYIVTGFNCDDIGFWGFFGWMLFIQHQRQIIIPYFFSKWSVDKNKGHFTEVLLFHLRFSYCWHKVEQRYDQETFGSNTQCKLLFEKEHWAWIFPWLCSLG